MQYPYYMFHGRESVEPIDCMIIKYASNAFSRWLSFIDQYLCDFNETYECGNAKLICANGHSIKLNSCSNHVANESILKERKRNKSFGCAANLDLRKRTHTSKYTNKIYRN